MPPESLCKLVGNWISISGVKVNERDSENGNSWNWFYCNENLAYFSEQKETFNEELDREIGIKSKSRVNAYNSDKKNVKSSISILS